MANFSIPAPVFISDRGKFEGIIASSGNLESGTGTVERPEIPREAPAPVLLVYAREVVGGPYCGGADEGEQFGRSLAAIWDRADRIRVSFRGVEAIELPFFQAAFRHLAHRHPVADILAKLEVVNPSERVLNLIDAAARFTSRGQGPGAGGQG